MPFGTDIRLPENVKPVFPNRCVYSGCENPDSEVVVIVNSQNPVLAFLAPLLMFFGWRKVRAPVLKRYRARFYFQNLGRNLIMIALVVAAVWYFMPSLPRGTAFRKFKMLGLVLLALSPWLLFEIFLPRRFDVTARGEWIDYEFASPEYAAEFAALNAPHIIET